jgi:hypothetical protein
VRLADALVHRVFLSLQVKELFEGTIALIVWEQHRRDLQGTLFCGYSENDGRGEVMPPHTLDTSVGDPCSAYLKEARRKDHLVFIEEQATIKRDATHSQQ